MTQKADLIDLNSIWERFLHYTHERGFLNDLIIEFNKIGCWMKKFRPTLTFINYLKEKKKELKYTTKNESYPNITKEKVDVISEYIKLIEKIRKFNILIKHIRELIQKNKGQYNAYDIEKWLLISDTSARNQLKRMFTEEEYIKYIRTQTYVSIDTVKEIAKNRGGICHSKYIKNAKSEIHLECIQGHHFFTTYNSVVYQRTWCSDCNIYISETICRKFFEKIFKTPFPKSYPKWLINENGNQMELDGYNKERGLAFEYQGIQHRKIAFGKIEKDLKNIQKEDIRKLELCEKNKVILLQIPDDEIVSYDEMQRYIEKKYEKKTGNTLKNIPKYDYRDFIIYENKYAKKFKKYVENKGGKLLTPYFSAKKEVKIICENGHKWITTPNSIYQDNWCSFCAGNIKGETEFFQKIGNRFDCILQTEYVNAKTPLEFKCLKGHTFKKSPYWLKKDYKKRDIICPDCKIDNYAQKFKNFLQKKEYKLLTTYKGRFKQIKINCKNNHIWKTTPAAIYQGSLCKHCKK